ncbi:hypothetical protein, partial [Ciceribacter sp. L1K22]|uniref:hypothetical protein n=1 Tax=Ciceribacter sp. L1K22 TaxID=2820275 RepID=UPI001ABE2C75
LRSRKPKTKTPPDRAPKNKKTRQAKIGGFVSSLNPASTEAGFFIVRNLALRHHPFVNPVASAAFKLSLTPSPLDQNHKGKRV